MKRYFKMMDRIMMRYYEKVDKIVEKSMTFFLYVILPLIMIAAIAALIYLPVSGKLW